ncbi:siderophore-interacting protein [Chitinasiproducens palmae]|uniref:NADPH-dependent ferric siderophore reductase, contains FAD-binding and SIP domains n=1 Tax=Chitinasiproducens palmae TaxID=1770053 RepID=A0A1H2PUD0_9BURK|nr:siderophore-interacting protein [Chitinasiproducens palmae]SDV50784.1 NADPH-dependent ferric siderophore reductase, contains FAD-binding and SIP domains [Chitinasiproducens palmae]
MTRTNVAERASGRPGWFSQTLIQLFMKRATVVACQTVGDGFRLITLESPQFRDVEWVAGQKIQIAMNSAFVARTFTPLDWDAEAGRARILVYVHGAGPGAAWAEGFLLGSQCDVFGPRASLDVRGVAGPLVVFGDETSIGIAHAITRQAPTRNVRRLLEVNSLGDAEAALASVDLHANELFARRSSDAHLADVEGLLPILATAGATFVLTGKATSIQHLRRALKRLEVPPGRLVAKAYWAPGKRGLD